METQRYLTQRRLACVALLIGVVVGLGACSSGNDDASVTTTTTPEQKIASDADVATGLAEISTLAKEIADAVPDTARAAKAAEELETVWQGVEGTVKQNEPDIYVDIEDGMSLLSSAVDGDEEKAPIGVHDIEASIASYLKAHPADGPTTSASGATRDDAVAQLQTVRRSIDETLALLKAGSRDEALAVAKSGYLDHFEQVEIPLRAAAPELTLTAEEKFAEIRSDIKIDASTAEIRDRIVELRGLVDDAERELTAKGLGAPSLVFGQAFLIMFREGLEAVLLLSALLGYLEATKNTQYRKHIIGGVGLAAVATVVTFFGMDVIFDALPFGREVLEAIVALLAVALLFYVSFWLIARLEQRRWMEFLRARIWTAVSVGSATSLLLIGFTSVYREGFETALFFQALNSFGKGLGGYVAAGAVAGAIALVGVSVAIFKLGRKLPIRVFLSCAVVLIMATSVAFLGNAIRSLQEADTLGLTQLGSWPRLSIFLAQATGYYPTEQGVIAQGALTALYVGGAVYMFVIRPRRTSPAVPVPAAVA